MAKDVIMPALGMAQASGVLIQWLVPEGGSVAEGDPLMEVETDKAVVEVPSPASGTLANVTVGEGAEVPVGTVMAVLLAEGEVGGRPSTQPRRDEPHAAGPAAPAPPGRETVAPSPTAAPRQDAWPASAAPASAAPASAAHVSTALEPVGGRPGAPAGQIAQDRPSHGKVLASPKAKRIAAERGLDLGVVRGSGPGGAVRAVDLAAAALGSAAGPERQAAVWYKRRLDASALAEFIARCNAQMEGAGGPMLSACDVLTRVVVATLERRAPRQLAGTAGSHAQALGSAVALSVTDGAGATATWRLAGNGLGSMYAVAAARSAGGNWSAGSAGSAGSIGSASLPSNGTGRSPAFEPFIAIADRSATRYERSQDPLPEAASLRFSLGPILEGVALLEAGAGPARVATLLLEVRPGLLSERDAVGLLNGVAQLLEDPFGIVVFG